MVDPAIINLLPLNASTVSFPSSSSNGILGGGCSSASTSPVVAKLEDGSEKRFFVKLASGGNEAKTMLEGEHASLMAIHFVVASLCPKSFGTTALSRDPDTYALVTEFIDWHAPSTRPPSSASPPSLAAKLALLHSTPAPVPPGFTHAVFGFPVPTCCGDTQQDNSYNESWAHFYSNSRLLHILDQIESTYGEDCRLRCLVEAIAISIVPRLIGDNHLNAGQGVTPVVVHGDLWSGNYSRGSFHRETADGDIVQDVVYDPSSFYGHSEYDLGIMKMFGGFGPNFMREYHQICPKADPAHEYNDRVVLYELYHHLNHYLLFGGHYRTSAVHIMEHLLQSYGNN